MPNPESVRAALLKHLEQRAGARRPALQLVARAGETAQTVLHHPGWQMFHDTLCQFRDGAVERRQAKEREMTDGDALGEALGGLKLDLVRLSAEIKTLSAVIGLIPKMVEEGEKAAAEAGQP